MGQQKSKDELLYQEVNYGNIEGIKALRRNGAGLEWIDKEAKTSLIVACMNPQLYNVAKTLIELGANVNAYRPGRRAGKPLHHAAKRGLERTVKLLLSHGANELVLNDDFQTPLDVARAKGYTNVVRAIEAHVCLFSGWLRELCGPVFLGLLAPQLLSRKVWVAIVPCGSRNPRKRFMLEVAIYTGPQDAQPRTIVPLWKANLEEPDFNMPDPAAIISNVSRIPKRWKRRRAIRYSQEARHTQIKLAPLHESEKQELQRFCNACKGIRQVMHHMFPFNYQVPTAPMIAVPTSEDEQLAMAISASLASASQERPHTYIGSALDASTSSTSSSSTNSSSPTRESKCEDWENRPCPSGTLPQHMEGDNSISCVVPSAPVATDDCPIEYPAIDMAPVELSSIGVGVSENGKDNLAASSCCTICLDAPVEGACVPCGHMSGCMSCLNEIKGKKWGCPVCRTEIDQVIRIYAV